MAKEDGDIDVSRLVMTGFFKSDHHIGIKALAGVVCVYVSHVLYVYMYRTCCICICIARVVCVYVPHVLYVYMYSTCCMRICIACFLCVYVSHVFYVYMYLMFSICTCIARVPFVCSVRHISYSY
jgi:hypothetical protein